MWSKTQTSFNAGELSPYLQQRPDIDKYMSGCQQLENFIVLPYGGVYRRPGTRYVGNTKGDAKARLIPFNFSTDDSFALEFGVGYIRFFKNGYPVLDGATAYEVVTPYTATQIQTIQYVQINDVLFLTHPDVSPRKLSRTNNTNWSLDELFDVDAELRDAVVYPPFKDQNTDLAKTVGLRVESHPNWLTGLTYPVGSGVSIDGVPYICAVEHTSGATAAPAIATGYWRHVGWDGSDYDELNVRSDFDFFGSEIGQVPAGSYLQLSYKRPATSISYELMGTTPAGNSNTNIITGVYGNYTVRTYGIWHATIKIQRAYNVAPTDDTEWETVAEFVGKSDRNVDSEGEENRANAFYRIVVEDYVVSSPAGASTPRVVFEVQDQYVNGLVEIVSIQSLRTARMKIYTMIYSSTPTSRWRVGSWNEVNGYPATVALHEQRLFYGGSKSEPQTVWGSGIDNFEDFEPGGTEDSDPVTITIASGEQNQIQWMVSRKKLVIGTSGAEWTLGSSDEDIPITPTNVVAKKHSSFGSMNLQGLAVNEVVFFAQRNGRKVREFTYSFENDGYVAPDMTRLAEHITSGGIVEWAYQQQRDQILWAVTGDGDLIGFTYERIDNVLGWHKHSTYAGTFESVCVVYGEKENDELWVVVKRTVNGSTVRFVEQFDPATWDYDKSSANRTELRYCDASVIRNTNLRFGEEDLYFGTDELIWVTASTGADVDNLDYLEGETVCVIADGAKHQDRTVASGAISLVASATDVVVGLPYTSTLKSMPLVTPAPSGTSQGRNRKVHELVFNLYQSSSGEFAPEGGSFDQIPYRDYADLMDAPPPLYTGDIEAKLHGGWGEDGVWVIRQVDPYPLTLLATTIKYNAGSP